ncbi:ras family-domain-containing protein [Mycena rosella]|uniref:small monomeric GTPase n=1 Tax=Mycena rosella TaxID=1033263 RepID=A0AAD7G631_MYCRO|nr:ras family-domain-containing protein [Mycena rosella]
MDFINVAILGDVTRVCVSWNGYEYINSSRWVVPLKSTVEPNYNTLYFGPGIRSNWDYEPHRKIIEVDARKCFVRVDKHEHNPSDGNAFILVYSVASRSSFARLETLYRAAQKNRQSTPNAVVGNQCDVDEERRQMSTEEGEVAARALGSEFAETSANTGEGVEGVIWGLVRARRALREGRAGGKTLARKRAGGT